MGFFVYFYIINLKQLINMEITFFKGLRSTKPVANPTLQEVLMDIKSDKYKTQVEKCHIDISKKDYLPCFTPTGIFNHRSIAGLEQYNGIICLDIDHLDDPVDAKKAAIKLNYVHAAFITPSGKGLKVIIKTNANVETYKTIEQKVADYFYTDSGLTRDNRCKDIARIQFVSHDPELYYNEESYTLNLDQYVEGAEC
jgi:hypothetical protein